MTKRSLTKRTAAILIALLCAAPCAVSAASPGRGENGWAEMQPPAAPVFRLHFETNGGEEMADTEASCLRYISLDGYVPARRGYAFAGWYLDEALTRPAGTLRLTRHTSVYAAWTPLSDPEETAPLTRAEFVTELWQAAGEPVVNYLMLYGDVDESAPYAEAVRWASSERIVLGESDDLFAPDAPLTREECAALLYRCAQKQGLGFTGAWMFLLPYEDRADISEWAYEAVAWCHMNGILHGADEFFLPGAAVTRGEGAAILDAFNAYLEETMPLQN